MEDARALSSLARLVHALGEEGIRFQIVGMSAAILQGVPATTLIRSKEFLARPKDVAHLPLLKQTVRLLAKRRKTHDG